VSKILIASSVVLISCIISLKAITVATRFKVWTVFVRYTLVSWVRIRIKAWMSVSLDLCSVCRQRPCDRLISRPRSPNRLCIWLRNWKSCQGPKSCRAIEGKNNITSVMGSVCVDVYPSPFLDGISTDPPW
jgi:hypothetical protein